MHFDARRHFLSLIQRFGGTSLYEKGRSAEMGYLLWALFWGVVLLGSFVLILNVFNSPVCLTPNARRVPAGTAELLKVIQLANGSALDTQSGWRLLADVIVYLMLGVPFSMGVAGIHIWLASRVRGAWQNKSKKITPFVCSCWEAYLILVSVCLVGSYLYRSWLMLCVALLSAGLIFFVVRDNKAEARSSNLRGNYLKGHKISGSQE